MSNPSSDHLNEDETEAVSKASNPAELTAGNTKEGAHSKEPNAPKGPSSSKGQYASLAAEATSLGIANTGVIGVMANAASKAFLYLGPVGFIVGMGIDVIKTPWTCYKEKRRPKAEEVAKLALCLGSIAFAVAAIAVPPLMGFLLIGAGAGGVGLSILEHKANKKELEHLKNKVYQLEATVKKEIDTLQHLEKSIVSPNISNEEKTLLSKQINESKDKITALKTQYLHEKQQYQAVNKKIKHPVLSFLSSVKKAMSAVTLVGLFLVPFVPVVGLATLAVAGIVSLGAVGASAIANKLINKPAVMTSEAHPQVVEESTKKELDELQNTHHDTVSFTEADKSTLSAESLETKSSTITKPATADPSITEEIIAWHHNTSTIHHELSHTFNEQEALVEESEIKKELKEERVAEEHSHLDDTQKPDDEEEDEFEMPK